MIFIFRRIGPRALTFSVRTIRVASVCVYKRKSSKGICSYIDRTIVPRGWHQRHRIDNQKSSERESKYFLILIVRGMKDLVERILCTQYVCDACFPWSTKCNVVNIRNREINTTALNTYIRTDTQIQVLKAKSKREESMESKKERKTRGVHDTLAYRFNVFKMMIVESVSCFLSFSLYTCTCIQQLYILTE